MHARQLKEDLDDLLPGLLESDTVVASKILLSFLIHLLLTHTFGHLPPKHVKIRIIPTVHALLPYFLNFFLKLSFIRHYNRILSL